MVRTAQDVTPRGEDDVPPEWLDADREEMRDEEFEVLGCFKVD